MDYKKEYHLLRDKIWALAHYWDCVMGDYMEVASGASDLPELKKQSIERAKLCERFFKDLEKLIGEKVDSLV